MHLLSPKWQTGGVVFRLSTEGPDPHSVLLEAPQLYFKVAIPKIRIFLRFIIRDLELVGTRVLPKLQSVVECPI